MKLIWVETRTHTSFADKQESKQGSNIVNISHSIPFDSYTFDTTYSFFQLTVLGNGWWTPDTVQPHEKSTRSRSWLWWTVKNHSWKRCQKRQFFVPFPSLGFQQLWLDSRHHGALRVELPQWTTHMDMVPNRPIYFYQQDTAARDFWRLNLVVPRSLLMDFIFPVGNQ